VRWRATCNDRAIGPTARLVIVGSVAVGIILEL